MIELPYWECKSGTTCLDPKLRYELVAFATSGTVSTQYFGHKFDAHKVERYFKYKVYIHPPSNYEDNSNITLYISIYKNIQPELDMFYSNDELTGVTILKRTESPPGSWKSYSLRREISEDALQDLQMDLMPGFRLTWHYSEELEPDSLSPLSHQYQYRARHTQRTNQFLRSFVIFKRFKNLTFI